MPIIAACIIVLSHALAEKIKYDHIQTTTTTTIMTTSTQNPSHTAVVNDRTCISRRENHVWFGDIINSGLLCTSVASVLCGVRVAVAVCADVVLSYAL